MCVLLESDGVGERLGEHFHNCLNVRPTLLFTLLFLLNEVFKVVVLCVVCVCVCAHAFAYMFVCMCACICMCVCISEYTCRYALYGMHSNYTQYF